MYSPTFVDAVLRGEAKPEDIDDWVEAWHKDNSYGGSICDYLGFSEQEYARWVENVSFLDTIIRNRQRPSFEEVYMELAESMSKRSTCARLQVGCAIVSSDYRKVYAVGYNGNASGLDNICDSSKEGACGCLHAEENAVINCDVPRERSKVVFCTHLPCKMCAKRIVNLGGVRRVFYEHDYRVKDSLEVFKKAGIMCVEMSYWRKS